MGKHKYESPRYAWLCDSCLFTAYEGAVEDPGYISMHMDPDDDEQCTGKMLRYELVRRPVYPDPESE